MSQPTMCVRYVRATSETPHSGRTVWTDFYPYGDGLRPRAAEIYVHMRTRPLIAVTTSELRRPEDACARPQGEPPKLEGALAPLYPEAIERAAERPPPALGPPDPRVDAVELALVRAADRRKLPILAICRGMQLLNVARGGTLHQHLPDGVRH